MNVNGKRLFSYFDLSVGLDGTERTLEPVESHDKSNDLGRGC